MRVVVFPLPVYNEHSGTYDAATPSLLSLRLPIDATVHDLKAKLQKERPVTGLEYAVISTQAGVLTRVYTDRERVFGPANQRVGAPPLIVEAHEVFSTLVEVPFHPPPSEVRPPQYVTAADRNREFRDFQCVFAGACLLVVPCASVLMSPHTHCFLCRLFDSVDALDFERIWHRGFVSDFSRESGKLRVHFDRFAPKWDEWYLPESVNLAPLGTHTHVHAEEAIRVIVSSLLASTDGCHLCVRVCWYEFT